MPTIVVKMPTIVGILAFIGMINTTSERPKARNFFICRYFSVNEQLQLIMLIDELSKNMQMGKQTDLILLDLSKAFDKVAQILLLKLYNYGIRGDTLKWIKDFLDNRKQAVVINGINSEKIPVSSSVPQGSVICPILCLAYINDLPEQVKSRVRLFADDTALYLAISSTTESKNLQIDLASLEQWEKMWDMQFNPSKCQVLKITIKAPQALHNTPPLLGAPKVIL